MKEIEELGYSVEILKKMNVASTDFKAFCYLAVKKYGNNYIALENIAEALGKNISDIKNNARLYKDSNYYSRFGKQDLEYHDKTSKTEVLVEVLLKASSQEEIVQAFQVVKFNNIRPDLIRRYLYFNYNSQYNEMVKIISSKMDVYRKYLQEQKDKKQKDIDVPTKALRIFKEVMQDNELMRYSEIRKKYGATTEHFDYWEKNVFEGPNNLEKKLYIDIIKRKLQSNLNAYCDRKYTDDILKIVPLLLNGVKIGNATRAFDFFDCLTYFGNDYMDVARLLPKRFVGTREDSDDQRKIITAVAILKEIFNKKRDNNALQYEGKSLLAPISADDEKKNIENILESRIHFARDYTKILTEDDKFIILEEMRKYHIPITVNNFWMAISRYDNKELQVITKDNIDEIIEKQGKKK